MDRVFQPSARCPFASECPSPGVGCVHGVGKLAGRQLTIAMEPGRDEVDLGEPLVGRTGQDYRNAVGQSTVADEFRTNVRHCYHAHPERKAERRASIEFCTKRFLDKEVEAFERAAPGRRAGLILMGEDAMRYWLGLNDLKKRVEKLHGSTWSAAEADAIARASATTVEVDDERDEEEGPEA